MNERMLRYYISAMTADELFSFGSIAALDNSCHIACCCNRPGGVRLFCWCYWI